jgi:hypothetical protein
VGEKLVTIMVAIATIQMPLRGIYYMDDIGDIALSCIKSSC